MPEAPSAAPAAPTQAAPQPSPASAPAPAAPTGPSNGMDLMAKLSGLAKPGQTPAKPEPKPTQKAAEPAKPASKPAETPKQEPKNPWDVEAVALDEPKPEPKPEDAQEQAPADLKPEAKAKWGELKSKAKELDAIKPEYEALKKKVEELEATPSKLPPEIESEITELKRFKAAYDVENTPEYQDSVYKPYEANMQKIAEVVDYAQIDMGRVEEAMKEQNTLARARKIREALSTNPDGPELTPEEIGIVINASNELHANVFPKDRELREKALEIQKALKGQQETLTAKQREAQEAAIGTAATELFGIMEAKLKPMGIFSDQSFVEALKTARPADVAKEPMTAVSQAMAAKLVPVLVGKYNEIATQLKEAKAALKARGESGATPGDSGRQTETKKAPDGPDEGQSLLSGISSFLGRR